MKKQDDPWHPDDYVTAYLAKEEAYWKKEAAAFMDGQIPYTEFAAAQMRWVRNMALARVSALPQGPWGDETWKIIRMQEGDAGFFLALSRAMKGTANPIFNPLECAILKYWRKISIGGKDFPGLWRWSPEAAAQALNFLTGIAQSGPSFNKARQRLGLKKEPLEIRRFVIHRSSAASNEILDITIHHRDWTKTVTIPVPKK